MEEDKTKESPMFRDIKPVAKPNRNYLKISLPLIGVFVLVGGMALTINNALQQQQDNRSRASGANILLNPGCENGTTYFKGYQASISTSTTSPHSGSSSCKVYSTGGTFYDIESLQTIASPQVGQSYSGSVWVRADSTNVGKKVFVALRESGGSSSSRTVYGAPVYLTTSWQQVSNTMTVQSSGRSSVDFYVVQDPASAGNAFYVDDMVFQSGATTSTTTTTQSTPASTISYVQGNMTKSYSTPTSVTLGQSVTAGNLIVVAVSNFEGSLSVSDNRGNTYRQAIVQPASATDGQIGIFYAQNVTGGSTTVTARSSLGSSSTSVSVAAYEYAGADKSAPFDKAMASGAYSSTVNSGSTAATSQANELVFGAGMFSNQTSASVTAGSGFTLRHSHADNTNWVAPIFTEDKIVSATGAQNAPFTLSRSVNWKGAVATFKAAAPAATATPVPATSAPTATNAPTATTAPSATPTAATGNLIMTIDKSSYVRGENMTVYWQNIPNATPRDWIGLYTPTAANGSEIGWIYVNCTQNATVAVPTGNCTFPIPDTAPDGTLELRLHPNDGNTLLVKSPLFTVTGGISMVTPTPTTPATPSPTSVVATNTIAPTATTVPGGTTLAVNLLLHGLGKGGDAVNVGGTGNMNPVYVQRNVTVDVFNAQNQLVLTKQGTVTFNPAVGNYTGNVDLGAQFTSGIYTVKVKSDQYLRGLVAGIQNITQGQTTNLSSLTLVAGDVNNDNAINIVDYNIIVGCYSDLLPPISCNDINNVRADINDDGKVNQFDYNLFIRELTNLGGQ